MHKGRMELYLLRHGIAEDQSPTHEDADRALTKEGIARLRDVLTTAGKAGVAPSLILTSPYLRARQTAELAREILKTGQTLVETHVLTPMAHPKEAWDEIRAFSRERSILLASHEPLMGQLLGFLLGTVNLQVDFKKGAIACVEVGSFGPATRATLKWFLTTKLSRA